MSEDWLEANRISITQTSKDQPPHFLYQPFVFPEQGAQEM